MSVSLVEVAGANFRTDQASDALNTKFMGRLGMRKRFLPARLAIARSLAIPSLPEPLNDSTDFGKVIKGDTLFGTGTSLSVWFSIIVERSTHANTDLRWLLSAVGSHWKRGIELLDREWLQSGEDIASFVRRLVEVAEIPVTGNQVLRSSDESVEITSSVGQINVPIGEVSLDVRDGSAISWNLNGEGGSPHCAIMGGVGSGKTRTAASMLRSIRERAAIPLLAFDFKGDLGSDSTGGGYNIDKVFNAKIVEPPRSPIPLDALSLNSTATEIDIAEAASRFRDSFSRLKSSRVGDRQRMALHDAASKALTSNYPCELVHIRDELERIYEEKEMKHDGALSTMVELCRFPLFEPQFRPISFFQQSWLVRLRPTVSDDCQSIVVNLLLDALDRFLNEMADAPVAKDGSRGLRILCLVDEAHRILNTKLPALSNMIRMSRSKGGAIVLISQSPDDFSNVDDEFLSEMGLVVAFSTNAPPRNASRILGKGANLGSLQFGECYLKRRGDRTAKRIRAW